MLAVVDALLPLLLQRPIKRTPVRGLSKAKLADGSRTFKIHLRPTECTLFELQLKALHSFKLNS